MPYIHDVNNFDFRSVLFVRYAQILLVSLVVNYCFNAHEENAVNNTVAVASKLFKVLLTKNHLNVSLARRKSLPNAIC